MHQSRTYICPISRHTVAKSRLDFGETSWSGQPLDNIYVGISGLSERLGPRVAIAVSKSTYLVDCLEIEFTHEEFRAPCSGICDSIIANLEKYRRSYLEKIVGVALPKEIDEIVPNLCSRLWAELDCIPLVLSQYERPRQPTDDAHLATFRSWNDKSLDEQADSMARKCIKSFGPGNIAHLDIGDHGLVEVDSAFHIRLANARDFEDCVTPQTWHLAQHYAADLKERGVKIAIFSTTAQGNANANAIKSLVRLSHCLGIDMKWYVPDPSPRASCVVGKMEKMLQGLSSPEVHITTDEKLQLLNWVYKNVKSHWLCRNGPLRSSQEGGADVVIIDDLTLSALALISKQHDPQRPVISKSRTNIHDGSVTAADSPQNQVLDFVWSTLKYTNILACEAPSQLKSGLIPTNKVGNMLASVDKLDGLNKDMKDWDLAIYGRQFNVSCRNSGTTTINYPDDQYIVVQMAHTPLFQHALTALEAYSEYCRFLKASTSPSHLPKLLICDRQTHRQTNEEFYASLASHIALHMKDLVDLISVKQISPPDQIWNALLSKAEMVILFSDTEDFEERFLEAVQKGKTVIRTEELGPYSSIFETSRNVFTVGIADSQAKPNISSKVKWMVKIHSR